MEEQFFRIMLIMFVVTINTTSNITAKNVWITKASRTVNADISIMDTKKMTAGTNMGKDEFSTKNEQENLSYSTVPTMHSNYSHHQDNSRCIGINVATVSILVVIIVVGVCYYKKFLCFKRNEKYDEETSSISMLNKKKLKKQMSLL